MKARSENSTPFVRKFRGFRWSGVRVRPYSDRSPGVPVTRQVLVGDAGERVDFHVRYFEVPPGVSTNRERHAHAHVVIAVRGEGEVYLGKKWRAMAFLDTCYIPPFAWHALRNRGKEPFGFFCLVDARREAASKTETNSARPRAESSSTGRQKERSGGRSSASASSSFRKPRGRVPTSGRFSRRAPRPSRRLPRRG
ncbi:MAG: hypothetical protein KatS3mg076_0641 [Candidatus Binatia bacterium]|nr:MAG: hypothetical protein KatS3mg076_0641 [Candidatus Binatia bacterium]